MVSLARDNSGTSFTRRAHEIIMQVLTPGEIAIDATVGNGHDTLFLAQRVGSEGKVFGFDIQQQALDAAWQQLRQAKLESVVTLFHAGHELIPLLIPEHYAGRVKAIMFNLGYLPGGDKHRTTGISTTLAALEASLTLLSAGGRITLLAYTGHPGGREEAEAVKSWAASLDPDLFRISMGQGLAPGGQRENAATTRASPPELIVIERLAAKAEYRPPAHNGLEILFRDESLLVLNKPGGLLSLPGKGAHKHDSLEVRVQQEFPQALTVHRLDMETSGLIIMALRPDAQRLMGQLFEQRKVEKTYIAVVHGQLREECGAIDLPLTSDWPNRPRQMIDHAMGKPSQTRYRMLSYNPEEHSSRVELTPVTGRTHQLRVHMQALGHPILGDPLYATGEALEKATRLLLHAHTLEFTHPVTGKYIRIESPTPF